MSGCVILMIDESAAMDTPTAKAPGGPLTTLGAPQKKKAESVATAVNALLNRLAQDSDCELAVVGYRTNAEGQGIVGCRWGGALAGREWVPAAELRGAEVTVEKRVRKIPGPGGFLQEQSFDFPVWYQPRLGDRAPHIAAFNYCRQLLESWAARPGASGTPLLMNFFAGSSADGNPLKSSRDVLELQTPSGSPLVVQIHLSSSDTVAPTLYPSNRAYLPAGPMRDLFERVSVLPDHLVVALKAVKVPINLKARGMIYHAKMEDVTRALGLIPAHLKPVAVAPAAARPAAPARPLPPAALAAAKPSAALAQAPAPSPIVAPTPAPAPTPVETSRVPGARSDKPRYVDEDVQFTVFRPKTVRPEQWYDLIAAAHLEEKRDAADEDEPEPLEKVRRKAKRLLGEQMAGYREVSRDSTQSVPHGGKITFLFEMDQVEFNPTRCSFQWLEDEHTENVRMRAARDLDGQTAIGQMSVFLGAILLADVPLKVKVDSSYVPQHESHVPEAVSARPYRKIFASYSHMDLAIVEQFERFAETLGDRYLRDWKDLRAGEHWDTRLAELIAEADVFQLFWSRHALDSEFVRREWEYALGLGRPSFVRPVYWEDPFPRRPGLPPADLGRIHFQRLATGGARHLVPEADAVSAPALAPAPVAAPTPVPAPVTPAPVLEETFPPPTEESYVPPPVEESYVPPPVEEAFAPPVAAGAEPTLGPITPDQPALILFVLDRSVDDPFSGNRKNACVRLQQHLGDMVEQIVKFGGGAIDVGVVTYGVDGMGEVEVRTTLEGGLSMRPFARDHELEAGAVRIDEATEEIPNGVGGLISISHRRPILVEAEPTYAAAATPAFAEVGRLVSEWCADHPAAGGPPVVIHLTRGRLDESDVQSAAAQLTDVATPHGAPVLYHLVETETDHATVLCPGDEFQLADPALQCLWRLTSPLLGRRELAAERPAVGEQARGLIVNGKPSLLLDALRRARC